MNYFLAVVAFWTLLGTALTREQNFTGHKLIGAFPSTPDEVTALRKLQDNQDVDFWNDPLEEHEKVTIRLPPKVSDKVEKELKDQGINYYVMSDDLQKLIDKEKKENEHDEFLAGRGAEVFELDSYHTFEEIQAYLDELMKKYPDRTVVFPIGTTYEGRNIRGVKVGKGDRNKPAIMMDGGIHSREWVAPATILYIMTTLAKDYGTDPEITKLVDTFDWYFIPVVNPDGYSHTWTENRLWRKNKSKSQLYPQCYGTDPNRNFDANFGGVGTSGNPCTDIYHGAGAFSEAESRAIRDVVLRLRSRLKAYFNLHAYSQLWMFPYGYTRNHYSKDHYDLLQVSQAASGAIQLKHGMFYRYGTIAQTIYPATGSASDWAYDVGGVKYSFAVELRDRGQFGFLLPRSEIVPTAEECWEGVKVVAKQVESELPPQKKKTKK